MLRASLSCILVVMTGAVVAAAPSTYLSDASREVKALAPQEISDYLEGKGMGFARAAELNGYPGPAHVLELTTELGLTEEQRLRTEALFKRMRIRAMSLGEEIVKEERTLDGLFASRRITSEGLGALVARIGRLQGEVRQVHLDAHIEQTGLLSPHQIEEYRRLRGYGMSAGHGTGHP